MSDDQDEEEILLYVEVNGLLDGDILDQSKPFFKLIDIDSDKPVMQIGREVFVGEYRDTLGTALIFEEDPLPPGVDPVFGTTSKTSLCFKCKTNKTLVMNRVFLKDKTVDSASNVPTKQTACGDADLRGSVDDDLISALQEGRKEIVEPVKPVSETTKLTGENEPQAGPSWATDVSQIDIDNIFSSKIDASTEEVSKLIAEHMSI